MIIAEGQVNYLTECEVVNSYKNEVGKTINVSLPLLVDVGKTYLVYLNQMSENHYEINSNISIIDIDSSTYEEAIKYIVSDNL